MNIRPLPPDVIKLLRSGIAITSPSQCVEELVFNALDAEATRITISLDLPYFKIRVEDNGTGIPHNQLKYVGERYSTSKCAGIEDLSCLKWYGFRGEAIASLIALCTTLEIETRPKSSAKTYYRLFVNGKPVTNGLSSTSRSFSGTTVTVQNFMHNLPVRQKSICPVMDVEQCRQRIQAISLIHPSVCFTLFDDASKDVCFHKKQCSSVISAFRQLFGTEKSSRMKEVCRSHGPFKVEGYISNESHPSQTLQFLYVNKRPVLKTRMHKVLRFYLERFLFRRQSGCTKQPVGSPAKSPQSSRNRRDHPIFVLNVTCSLDEYDICFEPRKTAVEFKNWSILSTVFRDLCIDFLKENGCFVDVDEVQCPVNPVVFNQINSVAESTSEIPTNVVNDITKWSDNISINTLVHSLVSLPVKRPSSNNVNDSLINSEQEKKLQVPQISIATTDKTKIDASNAHSFAATASHEEISSTPASFGPGVMNIDTSKMREQIRYLNTLETFRRKRKHVSSASRRKPSLASENHAGDDCDKIREQDTESDEGDHFTRIQASESPVKLHAGCPSVGLSGLWKKKKNREEVMMPLRLRFGFVPRKSEFIRKDSFASKSVCSQVNHDKKQSHREQMTSCAQENSHTSVSANEDTTFENEHSIENSVMHDVQCEPSSSMGPSLFKVLPKNSDCFSGNVRRKDWKSNTSDLAFMDLAANDIYCEPSLAIRSSLCKQTLSTNAACYSGNVSREDQKSNNSKLAFMDLAPNGVNSGPSSSLGLSLSKKTLSTNSDCYSVNVRREDQESNALKFVYTDLAPLSFHKLQENVASLNGSNHEYQSADDDMAILTSVRSSISNFTCILEQTAIPKTLLPPPSPSSASPDDVRIEANDLLTSLPNTEPFVITQPFSVSHESPLVTNMPKETWATSSQGNVDSPSLLDTNFLSPFPADKIITLENQSLSAEVDAFSSEDKMDDSAVVDSSNINLAGPNECPEIDSNSSLQNPTPCSEKPMMAEENVSMTSLTSSDSYLCKAASPAVDEGEKNSKMSKAVTISCETVGSDKVLVAKTSSAVVDVPSDSKSTEPSEIPDTLKVLESSDSWLQLTDKATGQQIYIDPKTGNSSYKEPPSNFSDKVPGRPTDHSKSHFFLSHNASPFMPRPSEERIRGPGTIFNDLNVDTSETLFGDGPDMEESALIKWNQTSGQEMLELYKQWKSTAFKDGAPQPCQDVEDCSMKSSSKNAVRAYNIIRPFKFSKQVFNEIEVIGQLDCKFIVGLLTIDDETKQTDKLVILLDQHAVHERIRLEQLLDDLFEGNTGDSNRSVKHSVIHPPLQLRMEKEIGRIVKRYEDRFRCSGLWLSVELTKSLTETASSVLTVRTVPSCLMERMSRDIKKNGSSVLAPFVEGLIREQVQAVSENRVFPAIPKSLYSILCSRACHGAVKFGDSLSQEECLKLVRSLSNCHLPFQCAHGRPTLTPLVDLNELEKLDASKHLPPSLGKLKEQMQIQKDTSTLPS